MTTAIEDGFPLQQWVIYDHPTDYPDSVVVRCWHIFRDGTFGPTGEVWLRDDIEGAREVINANYPDGYRLDRHERDDSKIIEVWV